MTLFGLNAEAWGIISAVATAAGVIIGAIGLIGAWVSIRQNTASRQLQVLDGVFRDIRDLDRQYLSEFQAMTSSQKNAWCATFFNTIEYLCFIVNHRLSRTDALKEFFLDEALPEWKKQFDGHVTNGFIGDNATLFPEFKKTAEADSENS